MDLIKDNEVSRTSGSNPEYSKRPKIIRPVKTERKPWEDENGAVLPDWKLRLVSRKWDEEIWDDYAETLEGKQKERVLGNFDKVMLMHDAEVALDDFNSEDDGDCTLHISPLAVRQALLKLTYKQRKLVELVIFKEMTVTRAAMEIGNTRRPASRMLTRALRHLKETLSPELGKEKGKVGR